VVVGLLGDGDEADVVDRVVLVIVEVEARRPREDVEVLETDVEVEAGGCAETGTTFTSSTAIGKPKINIQRRFIPERYAETFRDA
jgi:hypothetical protein